MCILPETPAGSHVRGYIYAGHDANVRGSSVVSDNATVILAGHDISITAATDTESASSLEEKIKSGREYSWKYKMRTIKLMADYHCFPLWEVPGDHVGNIDPDSLPLSDSLKIKILNWADVYDATLNIDDPAISGFLNIGAAADFEAQGLNLADKIREELGPDFKVLFSAKAYIKSLRS